MSRAQWARNSGGDATATRSAGAGRWAVNGGTGTATDAPSRSRRVDAGVFSGATWAVPWETAGQEVSCGTGSGQRCPVGPAGTTPQQLSFPLEAGESVDSEPGPPTGWPGHGRGPPPQTQMPGGNSISTARAATSTERVMASRARVGLRGSPSPDNHLKATIPSDAPQGERVPACRHPCHRTRAFPRIPHRTRTVARIALGSVC